MAEVILIKFGSSVLRNEGDLGRVVHEIYRHWREGKQVLAVVSALGRTTDYLLQKARSLSTDPDVWALAALLGTGEATATALLGIALEKAGIPVKVLDAAQAELRTSGPALDSELVSVNRSRLQSELEHAVVVLPGFVGLNEAGRTTVLGRGGSDLSALFLAHQLSAECVLIKDVDGLYTSDPACHTAAPPQRFDLASYETASRVGGIVVQPKAVRFAASHKQSFTVTAIGQKTATRVGPFIDSIGEQTLPPSPLRVALVGCGTVGGGVYERLTALSEFFEVTGVAVRNRDRSRTIEIPKHLLTEDAEELIRQPCDVVIELMGGVERAESIVSQALGLGRHVVTANKALIAQQRLNLERLADRNGALLFCSAAVGGALPALETVRRASRLGRIRSISGILNATTNFVLDRLAESVELETAISEAQAAGYAEVDPTLDLDGTDAAQKLVLLAAAAFDASLPFQSITRQAVLAHDEGPVVEARRQARCVRPVAFCNRTQGGFESGVSLMALPLDHPLASVSGAQNRLIVELENGHKIIASGKGAGRWPTTEAVIADLLEIARHNQEVDATEELEECVA